MPRPPDWLLRQLRALPGVQIDVDPEGDRLTVQSRGGRPVAFRVLSAIGLSSDEASRRATELSRTSGATPVLLAARSLPSATREELVAAGVSWAERATGDLHLQAAPLFVHVEGQRTSLETSAPSSGGRRPTRLVGLSGRCAETLLLCATSPQRLAHGITTTELSTLAGVTQPQATYVLHRLEREQLLTPIRRGARTTRWQLADPNGLLDLWAAEDTAPVQETQLYVWSRAPQELLQGLARLSTSMEAWALGGAAAANVYAPTLTAFPAVTVWIPNAMPAEVAARALDGTIVSDGGSITVRQTAKDPWARHRCIIARDGHEQHTDTSVQLDDALHDGLSDLPDAAAWRGLSLVSRPRAVIESMRDGRGRSDEVAQALHRAILPRNLAV